MCPVRVGAAYGDGGSDDESITISDSELDLIYRWRKIPENVQNSIDSMVKVIAQEIVSSK